MAFAAFVTLAHSSSASADSLNGSYTIQPGDSLSKVAEQHSTKWEKLWQDNPYITDPNLIYVGNQLSIVTVTATKPEPVAAPAPQPVTVASPPACDEATQWVRADNGQCLDKPGDVSPKTDTAYAQIPVVRNYAVSGNNYDEGACTWYVKNMRPDLPNNLGNADDWYWNAQADGLPTGTTARVGAAAMKKWGQHVVYVLDVYDDGTMLVGEMNYDYVPFHQRTAVKNQSDFYYIY